MLRDIGPEGVEHVRLAVRSREELVEVPSIEPAVPAGERTERELS